MQDKFIYSLRLLKAVTHTHTHTAVKLTHTHTHTHTHAVCKMCPTVLPCTHRHNRMHNRARACILIFYLRVFFQPPQHASKDESSAGRHRPFGASTSRRRRRGGGEALQRPRHVQRPHRRGLRRAGRRAVGRVRRRQEEPPRVRRLRPVPLRPRSRINGYFFGVRISLHVPF